MRVKIVNVLGNWKIATDTGAFYPGEYKSYQDALDKCSKNKFEVYTEEASKENAPAKAEAEKPICYTKNSLINSYGTKLEKVKFDILRSFTGKQQQAFMTVKEVSLILGVSIQQVMNYIDEGLLSSLNISSGSERRALRILPASLLDFIVSRLDANSELSAIPKEALISMRNRIDEFLSL